MELIFHTLLRLKAESSQQYFLINLVLQVIMDSGLIWHTFYWSSKERTVKLEIRFLL